MTVTTKNDELAASIAPVLGFLNGPIWARNTEPGMAVFAVGNPTEMPLPGYVDALRSHLEPRSPDWFAYKLSEPDAQAVVARSLSARTGLDWDPADVAMTNGGFAALAVAFRAILEPDDEVVFLSPPWFFYELLILAGGGRPARVPLAAPTFDLDPATISAAITERTRAVILNSPHNPSGRVYPLGDLQALAAALEAASARIGRTIYLVSDEPYNRIVFDDRPFHSPAEVYSNTITTYSYGKTLLAPGMRIGYLTVPPTMPDREALRERVLLAQLATGFAFPNALLQHAIGDLEKLSIDVGALERRRDRLVPALRGMGYETTMPEGTFYVMARSPIDDDVAFGEALADEGVLVLPGTVVETPGWFRISLTASDEMVERGLAGFARARDRAGRT
ncbi:MAG TPA: aminotransferase class I/II-fold pyridoxal phosphate-dependent enzyme [Candidatus Limnocylindrales bacterium]|nr:aminotransferase class I/II-fold pyridoxal phosphate-dependent enzyme [Candidatus Limnocylindrales bacterium]